MKVFRPARGWKMDGTRPGMAWGLACALSGLAPAIALAQTAAPPPVNVLPPGPQAAAVPPGSTSMTNLIRALVQQGALTQAQADELLREAQDEAAIAARTGSAPVAPAANQPASSIRVPYIPQTVRNQIRDEVKDEVMTQARAENWAAPNAVPEWVQRFKLYGDFRLRYEADMFDSRNSFFPNYAMLDSGSPFDLHNAAGTPPPILDTTVDRYRPRIAARLGVNIIVNDDFSVGIRMATGNTTNPVTINETQGNTLNDDNFQLDLAYLEYHPTDWARLWLGRFANPWFSTNLVWYQDIAFDGVAAQFSGEVVPDLSTFLTVGAFPIQNTAFNFPDNSTTKGSRDKWLFGAQAGVDWLAFRGVDLKFGTAYYDYSNLEGVLSTPCVANTASDPCSTDDSIPGFLQGGNTLFGVRDLVSNSTSPPEFQYYGLATPFREINVTARLDVSRFGATHVILDGDFVKNLAFDANTIAAKNPVNNLGPAVVTTDTSGQTTTTPGPFVGGNMGYQTRLLAGYPDISERWQWNFSMTYKYVESDAEPDAFDDSDFRLGGTNDKGYIIGAAVGVAHNVNLAARWMSATEVSGPPYSVDIVQVDLNARF
jgi:Putative porin